MAHPDDKENGEEILHSDETIVEQHIVEEDVALTAATASASSEHDVTLAAATANGSSAQRAAAADHQGNDHKKENTTAHHEYRQKERDAAHHKHKHEGMHADEHGEQTREASPAVTSHEQTHEASHYQQDQHERVTAPGHRKGQHAPASASNGSIAAAIAEDEKEQASFAAVEVKEKILTTKTVIEHEDGEVIIPAKRRRRFWFLIPFLLLLLALLGWLLLSSWNANATVISNSQAYSSVFVVYQQAQSFSQQGYQQVSIPATPTTLPGTPASGTLTFHNAAVSCGCTSIPAGTIFRASNGITVATDTAAEVGPQCSVTVPAHTLQGGLASNIAAYSVHTTYLKNISVNNMAGFAGGQSPYAVSIVGQSAIERAETSLVRQLQKTIPPAFQAAVEKQGLSIFTTTCETHAWTDHRAGDVAQSITVRASIACHAQAYHPQNAQKRAMVLFEREAYHLFGSDYVLASTPSATLKSAALTDANKGIVQVIVSVSGSWNYQFGQQQKQMMAQFIAGHTISDVQMFLQQQRGVRALRITTSGLLARLFPSLLPVLPGHIVLSTT